MKFLVKNDQNETEKLMDVRKKSLSPNKKSNAEPALKVSFLSLNFHRVLPVNRTAPCPAW